MKAIKILYNDTNGDQVSLYLPITNSSKIIYWSIRNIETIILRKGIIKRTNDKKYWRQSILIIINYDCCTNHDLKNELYSLLNQTLNTKGKFTYILKFKLSIS